MTRAEYDTKRTELEADIERYRATIKDPQWAEEMVQAVQVEIDVLDDQWANRWAREGLFHG